MRKNSAAQKVCSLTLAKRIRLLATQRQSTSRGAHHENRLTIQSHRAFGMYMQIHGLGVGLLKKENKNAHLDDAFHLLCQGPSDGR